MYKQTLTSLQGTIAAWGHNDLNTDISFVTFYVEYNVDCSVELCLKNPYYLRSE